MTKTNPFTPQDAERLREQIEHSLGQGPVIINITTMHAMLDLIDALRELAVAASKETMMESAYLNSTQHGSREDCDAAFDLVEEAHRARRAKAERLMASPHGEWLKQGR